MTLNLDFGNLVRKLTSLVFLLLLVTLTDKFDPLKAIYSVILPEEDSFGSLAMRLEPVVVRDAPSPPADKTKSQTLYLLKHDLSGKQQVTFFLHGDTAKRSGMVIGAHGDTPFLQVPSRVLRTPIPLLQAEIPKGTIIALTSDSIQPSSKVSFSTGGIEKEMSLSADLHTRTTNDIRKLRMLYLLSFIVVGIVASSLPKFRRITFGDSEPRQETARVPRLPEFE